MNREEIYASLAKVFKDVFDDITIEINDDTTAADVEDWDSLTHITLIRAVEDEFDITFNMKTVVGMKNVGEMVDYIEGEL